MELTKYLLAAICMLSSAAFGQLTQDGGIIDFEVRGEISEKNLIEYLLVRNGASYGDTIPIDGSITQEQLKRKFVQKDLDKLKKFFGHAPPYDAYKVEKVLEGILIKKPVPNGTENESEIVDRSLLGWHRNKNAWLLRGKPDDYRELKKSEGAMVQFLRNHVSGEKEERWTTTGAIIYKMEYENENLPKHLSISKHRLSFGPALYWNVVDTNGDASKEVEELQFSFPLQYFAIHRNGSISGSLITLKPYYHTNFSLDGGILGATLSYEPITQIKKIGKFNLALGSYVALTTPALATTALNETLSYRLRIVPKIDFSDVLSEGDFSTRDKNDDWLRVGALLELGIRPFGKNSNYEFLASYEFFRGLNGAEKYSYLMKLKAIKWLEGNHIGLSAEYQKGETPISDKEIDLLTLGMEFRY